MTQKGAGRGDFFAIDHRCWPVVCRLGLNAAIAYLTIARGSAIDQRTSIWSINAVEKRTAISRHQAKAAIDLLEATGLVSVSRLKTRPKYFVVPAHQVAGTTAFPPKLDFCETDLLRKGEKDWNYATGKSDQEALKKLVKKGLVEQQGSRYRALPFDKVAAEKPVWTWLPNALIDPLEVTGRPLQPAPVELIRQTQDIAALRLFIELYSAHRLDDSGGIHWRAVRQEFTRHKISERAEWIVWSFVPGASTAFQNRPPAAAMMTGSTETVDGKPRDKGWPVFWAALAKLRQLKLLETVPHLIEADSDDAAVIHPCPTESGEPAERALAASADEAAQALCAETGLAMAERLGGTLAPILAHMTEVQMVGIIRLRYRPRTGATAKWLAGASEWAEWEKRYDAIASQGTRRRAVA